MYIHITERFVIKYMFPSVGLFFYALKYFKMPAVLLNQWFCNKVVNAVEIVSRFSHEILGVVGSGSLLSSCPTMAHRLGWARGCS